MKIKAFPIISLNYDIIVIIIFAIDFNNSY